MSRPNVLLFGLGGIGGIYACILHLSGQCDVSVVARSNYEAVKTKGFRLISNKERWNHDDIKFAGGRSCCFPPGSLFAPVFFPYLLRRSAASFMMAGWGQTPRPALYL